MPVCIYINIYYLITLCQLFVIFVTPIDNIITISLAVVFGNDNFSSVRSPLAFKKYTMHRPAIEKHMYDGNNSMLQKNNIAGPSGNKDFF